MKGRERVPALVRFEAKVIPEALSGCWLWVGAINANGYGSMYFEGRVVTASRVAYHLYVGSIPDGLLVLHRCDVPICVRPDHLFLGTNADNRKDCQRKGRAKGAIGERNPHARLTEAQVLEIRASDESYAVIARRFGVHRNYVSWAKRGKTWRHL